MVWDRRVSLSPPAAGPAAKAPIGLPVGGRGVRPFLIVGSSLMALSITGMGVGASDWHIALLAMRSGLGISGLLPSDYPILSGSVYASGIGRSFSIHTFL